MVALMALKLVDDSGVSMVAMLVGKLEFYLVDMTVASLVALWVEESAV